VSYLLFVISSPVSTSFPGQSFLDLAIEVAQYPSYDGPIRCICGRMVISDHFLSGIPTISSNPFENGRLPFTPSKDSHLPILSFHHPYPPDINPTGSILSTSLYKPALTPATKQLTETNTLVYSLLPTSR
jgi:hypothetical protein